MLEQRPTDLLLLGDGQLARMTIQAAHKRGLRVGVIGSSRDSSAGQLLASSDFYRGDITKGGLHLQIPIEHARFVGLDTEHVAADYLKGLELQDRYLFPVDKLPLTQDKLAQHQFLRKFGVPMPEFIDGINCLEDLQKAAQEYDFRGVLQTGHQAYDGRGNAFISDPKDVERAWNKVGERGKLFLEKAVNFETELAVQVVRGRNGQNAVYPVVQSQHVDGQLYFSEASRNSLFTQADKDAVKVAKAISALFPGVGLMTVELFKYRAGQIPNGHPSVGVNELCLGRPHNSQHLTIVGMETSQFDQLARLAAGLPIGSTSFREGVEHAAMVNLLGAKEDSKEIAGLEEIEAKFGVYGVIYGKPSYTGRKLGHLSTTGEYREESIDRLSASLEVLNSQNNNRFQVHNIK